MSNFNPTYLTLLRLRAGLSQSALASQEVLGLKQAALSKYEKGVNVPSSELVEKLARFFGVLPEFFYRSNEDFTEGLIYHRKRSALSATERGKLEAEAKLRAMEALAVYQANDIRTDILPRDGRTPQEMAHALRRHWRLPDGPVQNVLRTLEEKGVLVLTFDFHTDLLDGFFLTTQGDVICLALNNNPVLPPDRMRFSALHELGHALLSREMFPCKEAEEEANEFAAEFLAPAEDIRQDLEKANRLGHFFELKTRWGMSVAALVRRAKDIGVRSEAHYRRDCIILNSLGYRKKEPLCGLTPEHTTRLPKLLAETFGASEEPWKDLCLTPEVFANRYGTFLKGGSFSK